jgi:thiamine biosynthesis protein ThiC
MVQREAARKSTVTPESVRVANRESATSDGTWDAVAGGAIKVPTNRRAFPTAVCTENQGAAI